MNRLKTLFLMGSALSCASLSFGQFVADEFNGGSLGTQWTFQDSDPVGSVIGHTGTHLSIEAMEGADLFFFIDKYTYVQQDAPGGTNWEIVTKLDDFDPTAAGKQNNWNKCGLMLWQDNDHWFGVWALGNDGNPTWRRGVEGAYNSDFVANRTENWHEWGGDQAYWDVTQNPVWLKIQKTENGYFGLVSYDGTTWIQVNRLIRNSQNAATGYFTNEKIRLIQSGPGTNGQNDVGLFDFIRTGPVAVPTASAGTNDEFAGTSLDPLVWGKHEGIEASTIAVSGGALRITPANFNDQWGGIDKAVRVFQKAPVVPNLKVTAKVGPTELFNFQNWTGYGLWLWQDQNDYASIANLRTDAGAHMVQAVYQRADSNEWNVDEINLGGDPLPAYLRIDKAGSTYTAQYSFDNVTWISLPNGGHTYSTELQNTQVQLLGKKVNDNGGPQMTAEFDWVHFDTSSGVGDWQLYN